MIDILARDGYKSILYASIFYYFRPQTIVSVEGLLIQQNYFYGNPINLER